MDTIKKKEYISLKHEILNGTIKLNTELLPNNDRVFTVMFHNNILTETVIHAVTGNNVKFEDISEEFRANPKKAYSTTTRTDIRSKTIPGDEIYSLDLQRRYYKKRITARTVYYASREISAQNVKDSRYEGLKSVTVVFLLDVPNAYDMPEIGEIMHRYSHDYRIYSDLMKIYEVNFKKITEKSNVPDELLQLKYFFEIDCDEKLRQYVSTYKSDFAELLVSEYFFATSEDSIVKQLEEADYFMYKSREEAYIDGKTEGLVEGRMEGIDRGKIELLHDLGKTKQEILQILKMTEERYETVMRNFEKAV